LGKPASLHATTGFLASTVYAGQHPKPQHRFPNQRKPLYWLIRPGLLHWCPNQENSQLLHRTLSSTLVLLNGKATFLPTLFFALHKQDSASRCFKQQFALNLHSVSVVHFALIDANWRISSFSRGFGLVGFCWPRIWIHVLRRSLELPGSIAPCLQVSSTCADNAGLLAEHQVRLFYIFESNNFLGWHFCSHKATPCNDIAFELFTNLQTFCATTRLYSAIVTFSSCFSLQPACAWQFLFRQSLIEIAHLQRFANFLLPFYVVSIYLFNRCFFLDCCCWLDLLPTICLSLLPACFS